MPRPMTAEQMSRRVTGQRPVAADDVEMPPIDSRDLAGGRWGPPPLAAGWTGTAAGDDPAPPVEDGGGSFPPVTMRGGEADLGGGGGWSNPGPGLDTRPPVALQPPPPVSINGRAPAEQPGGAFERMLAAGDRAYGLTRDRMQQALNASGPRFINNGWSPFDLNQPSGRWEGPGEHQQRVLSPLLAASQDANNAGRLAMDQYLGAGNLGVAQQRADTERAVGMGNLDLGRGRLGLDTTTAQDGTELGRRRQNLEEYRLASDTGIERQRSMAAAGMLANPAMTPQQFRTNLGLFEEATGGRSANAGFVPGRPYGNRGDLSVGPPPPVVVGPAGGPAGPNDQTPRTRAPDAPWHNIFGPDLMTQLERITGDQPNGAQQAGVILAPWVEQASSQPEMQERQARALQYLQGRHSRTLDNFLYPTAGRVAARSLNDFFGRPSPEAIASSQFRQASGGPANPLQRRR